MSPVWCGRNITLTLFFRTKTRNKNKIPNKDNITLIAKMCLLRLPLVKFSTNCTKPNKHMLNRIEVIHLFMVSSSTRVCLIYCIRLQGQTILESHRIVVLESQLCFCASCLLLFVSTSCSLFCMKRRQNENAW